MGTIKSSETKTLMVAALWRKMSPSAKPKTHSNVR